MAEDEIINMNFVISGINVKVLGKAIHSLSKIGDELYIESLQDGLALRTVNSVRSAYTSFIFSAEFFESLDAPVNGDKESCTFKILMKPCLSIFKSLTTLEKSVERCHITVNSDTTKLILHLRYTYGLTKTFHLPLIDCSTMQAVFSRDKCANSIFAKPKLLMEMIQNFQLNQEEITLVISEENLHAKSYTEEEPDPAKVVHTEIILNPEEFEAFNIVRDAAITFCLKDLRGFLSFCDLGDCETSLHFDDAGQPIIFTINFTDALEADLVLSTIPNPKKHHPPASTSRGPVKTATGLKPKNQGNGQSLSTTSDKVVTNESTCTTNGERDKIIFTETVPSVNIVNGNFNDDVPVAEPPTKKFKSLFSSLLDDSPVRDDDTKVVLVSDSEDEDG